MPAAWVRPVNPAQGVSFFFVLSGFILGYVYLGRECSPRAFYAARLARIWPATMGSLVLVVLLLPRQLLLPTAGSPWLELGSLGASVLLLQSLVPIPAIYFGFNAVAWSVSTEACFYAMFPWLLRLLRRSWLLVLLLSSGLGLALVAVAQWWQLPGFGSSVLERVGWHGLIYIHPAARFQEFLLGLLAAMLFLSPGIRRKARRWLRGGREPLVALVLVLAAWSYQATALAGLWPLSAPLALLLAQWGQGLLFALLIAVLACEAGWLTPLLRWRPLVLLGEISFALYLLHQGLMILLVQVHPQLLGGLAGPWRFPAVLLAALGLAYAQWRWLECPARHLLRNRLGQGTGPRRLVLRSLRPETLPDTPVADDGVCKR